MVLFRLFFCPCQSPIRHSKRQEPDIFQNLYAKVVKINNMCNG